MWVIICVKHNRIIKVMTFFFFWLKIINFLLFLFYVLFYLSLFLLHFSHLRKLKENNVWLWLPLFSIMTTNKQLFSDLLIKNSIELFKGIAKLALQCAVQIPMEAITFCLLESPPRASFGIVCSWFPMLSKVLIMKTLVHIINAADLRGAAHVSSSDSLSYSLSLSQVQWYFGLRYGTTISNYTWQITAKNSVSAIAVKGVWYIRSCGKIRGLLLQWATENKKLYHTTEIVKCWRMA